MSIGRFRDRSLLILFAATCALCPKSHAGWFTLPEPPTAFQRYEDIHFVDANSGWLVEYASRLYRTSDGGAHWELVGNTPQVYYRSVAFVTAERGWIGTVDSASPLLETTDGGSTWSVVPGIPAFVSGICGLWVLDDQTVVGSGEYNGPGAAFIKTTNAGATWTAVDLSGMASGLVDCYFSSPSTGIVVGHLEALNDHRTVALRTTDGGTTWTTRYTGSRTGEHGWKVSFPTPEVGYVAIDHSPPGQQYILKTTDGGLSFTELPSVTGIRQQGIGFLDATTGWVGGFGFTSITTDGGMSWQSDPWGQNVNSIGVLPGGFAYAVGKRAYRYAAPAGVDAASGPGDRGLHEVLGNPFRSQATISYHVPAAAHVRLSIVTPAGSEIDRPVDGWHDAGVYRASWSGTDDLGRDVPSGVYFTRLTVGARVESRKLFLLR